MERPHEPLGSALATLRTRWGSAAVRIGSGRSMASEGGVEEGPLVRGNLALAPLPEHDPTGTPPGADVPEAGVISTGFPKLDALLGPRGLPREASVVVRGGPSSGKTTLALRCVAEAQAAGDIVAWLDLTHALDPVEAAGRGVDLRWLLVIRPADTREGLALAAALLSGHCLGLLVVDLPARSPGPAAESFRRLVAHARRTGARLIVLESATGGSPQAALAEVSGLRLELERRAWLRLGRDIIGQCTTVVVAKNRYGTPGRSVDLEIRYLPDGERSVVAGRAVPDGTGHQHPVGAAPRPRPRLVVA